MSLWQNHQPLVLASRSPSRRAMLEAAGIPIEVCIPDLDERAVEAAAGICRPADAAALLAREKAKAVARLMPQRLVIGADQTLAFEDRRFDKPPSQWRKPEVFCSMQRALQASRFAICRDHFLIGILIRQAAPCWSASGPINLKRSGFICSTGSREIILRSWGCHCSSS